MDKLSRSTFSSCDVFQRAGHLLQEAAEQAALRQQQEMEERRQRHLEALVQETEEVLRGFQWIP